MFGAGMVFMGSGVGGKQEMFLPAGAFVPQLTNGPSAGVVELGTNKQPLVSLDFDTGTQELACCLLKLPNRWNDGTITFVPYWTAASGSGTAAFILEGVALSNDDAMDTTYGTGQSSSDTLITANDMHIGPESSAITIGGTPAAGDLVMLRIKRDVANDSLGVDAKLLGISLFWTQSGADDS